MLAKVICRQKNSCLAGSVEANLSQLTLRLLGIFCMLFCRLMNFPKSTFLKNSFRNTISVSNSLDPDQARHFVRPDLGPKCLQRVSADDTGR